MRVLCARLCGCIVLWRSLGCLVGVSVFSMMCSELLIMSEISLPLWSSVCEYQSVECVESGMLVTCRMQYAMYVSTVL